MPLERPTSLIQRCCHCLYSLRVHSFNCKRFVPWPMCPQGSPSHQTYGPISYKHKNVFKIWTVLSAAGEKNPWVIYAGCTICLLGLIFYQIIQDPPVFIDYALPCIITKMVAHQRGTLKWTTRGCQTLTFPYFIVFTLWNRHILSLCLFNLESSRQKVFFPYFKKQVFKVLEFLFTSNFFSISRDTSFFFFLGFSTT